MLKLKKLPQEQFKQAKSAEKTSSISGSNKKQTQKQLDCLTEEQEQSKQLKKILVNKQKTQKDSKELITKISILLNNMQSSIESNLFALIMQNIFSNINQNNHKECIQILSRLILIPHGAKEVKNILKSNKVKLDAISVLVILWRYRNLTQLWRYVQYVIECYPTDLRLNGKQILALWKKYINQRNQILKMQQKVWSQIASQEVGKRIKDVSNLTGFQDIEIQL